MKKLAWILVLAGLWCLSVFAQGNRPAAPAQANNRVSTFLRKALAQRSEAMAEAAAQMPPDKYAFKAPPDDKTFGYLTLHIADGNYLFCAPIGGVPSPQLPQLNESDPKQTLIDRMKSSFEFCTKAVANLDDSHMSEVLNIGEAKMSRAMAVLTLTGSWATHYELQEKYLSLNGYPARPTN
jgi:DinB superfamily